MTAIRYPSLAEVIAIHDEVLRRLGNSPQALRDAGALESAIMRPQMAAWYEAADLARQTALLANGVSQAQAFLDGNKRTAYLALVTLLEINGHTYTGNHISLAEQFEVIAERSLKVTPPSTRLSAGSANTSTLAESRRSEVPGATTRRGSHSTSTVSRMILACASNQW